MDDGRVVARQALRNRVIVLDPGTYALWLAFPQHALGSVSNILDRVLEHAGNGGSSHACSTNSIQQLVDAGLLVEKQETFRFERVSREFAARPRPSPLVVAELQAMTGDLSEQDVAEVGCGDGRVVALLADFKPRSLRGYDQSETLISSARKRLTERAALHVARAEDLPLPNASLDWLVVADAVHWFEAEPFWQEAARVLRPGGCVVVMTTFLEPDSATLFGRFLLTQNYIERAYETIRGAMRPPDGIPLQVAQHVVLADPRRLCDEQQLREFARSYFNSVPAGDAWPAWQEFLARSPSVSSADLLVSARTEIVRLQCVT